LDTPWRLQSSFSRPGQSQSIDHEANGLGSGKAPDESDCVSAVWLFHARCCRDFCFHVLLVDSKGERAMRSIIKSATSALLTLVLVGHARADEPKVITLSCEGTLTPSYGANKVEAPQQLQKTGVVINLDEQTVFFLGYVVSVYDADEVSISFGGRQTVDYGFRMAIRGNIDRITGRMEAMTALSDPTKQPDPNTATIHYDVVCK
jgi:hypothetical protein